MPPESDLFALAVDKRVAILRRYLAECRRWKREVVVPHLVEAASLLTQGLDDLERERAELFQSSQGVAKSNSLGDLDAELGPRQSTSVTCYNGRQYVAQEAAGTLDPSGRSEEGCRGIVARSEGQDREVESWRHGQAETAKIVGRALAYYFRFAGDRDAIEDYGPDYFTDVAEALLKRLEANGLVLCCRTHLPFRGTPENLLPPSQSHRASTPRRARD